MAAARSDDPASIAARLRLIRLAYSALQRRERPISQSAFARLCQIGIAAWNNAETGDNRLGLDNGLALRKLTGATLDYIYCDDRTALPYGLAVEIARLEKISAIDHIDRNKLLKRRA